MAVNQYKRSQLGELGKFLDSLDEKDKKQKETTAVLESKKENQVSQYGADLTKFLDYQNDKNKAITKKSHLEAQAKRLWETPVVAETRASNHNFAPLTTEQLSKAEADRQLVLKKQQEEAQAAKQKEEAFRASERDYAARRAALAEKGKTTPVTTNVNPATDWLDYQVKSSQNAGAQSFEDIANGLNAAGAGILADIKTTANAVSGDKTAQEEKKNDIKTTFGKIKDAFEKSRENPYGTPDEQLTEGDHLGNLRKWWNAVNPVSNAAKAASTFASSAYNKAVADYLNDYASVDPSEIRQAEIERTHPTQASKGIYSPTQITKNVLSNTSRMLPQIVFAKAVGGKLGSLAGGATLGYQSLPSAYREAKSENATDEQAVKYANLEFFNQGFGDAVLNGISGATVGLLDAPISKLAASITKTPLLKTVIQTAANVTEEGGQELIQNYISTVNKRLTYDSDAEFDVEGAVYEGVLGGINALALSPGKTLGQYKVNRSAYETVNSLSKAAGNVSTTEEANVITRLANEIVEDANTVLSDESAEAADKSNAEYIKKGAEAVKEKLDNNSSNIIKNNQSVLEKTQEIIRLQKTSDAEYLSALVKAVNESGYGGNSANAVNNTVDYVNELIKEHNQIANTAKNIASMQDSQISEDANTAAAQKQKASETIEYTDTIIPELKKLSETLRSNRNEINSRLKIDENISTQSTQTETARTSERVSGKAYNSEVAATLRSTYGGSSIKETAENIIKNKGNVRSAVDYVHEVYSKTGGSNSDTATREYLTALDKEIRTANRDYLAKNTARLESVLKEYGVSNVEIDDNITPLSDNGKYAWGQAHYDRNTGKIYVSPYADANSVIGSKIIHEFTHHGAKADTSLVNDILTAARNSKSFNKEVKLSDGTTTNTVDNISSLIRENYANEINEYIALSKNVSRYSELIRNGAAKEAAAKTAAEEYRAQNTAEYDSLVKDYIDEDTAAYVMEYLNQDTDVLSKLIEENRPLWKRILDKIEDFIAKITGQTEAREYQKAADKIREILGSEIDAKVENTGSFKAIQQQIKNGNSKIGNTSDGRKFSMELNVDESNGLFAIHNLTADSFIKSYKLGGFAMPSIAIARSDVGHSNFGDISLVFASDTINPANPGNKVYSADAWTPTFPRIEYEANSKVTDRLRDKYYELYRKFGQDKVSALYPYGNYFEEQLNTDGGVDGIISKQSDNPQMMQVYLADTQGKTVDSVVKETKTTLPSEQVEQSEFIIDKLGADTVNEMRPQANESPISARKRWMSEHGDAFKAAYADYLMQSGLTSEEVQNAIDNMTVAQLSSQVIKARNYLANGAETVKSEVDTEATNNAIKEAVNQEDYLKWLHSLFDGGEKKSGVSNGKDPYTRNGNLRSFSATHYPVTLDNIVLSMKSQGDGNTKNATSIFVGSKTIRAESATEYSSLDEIRADKGRLAHRTPEEAKAAWNEFDNRLSAIINRIMDAESGIDNRFIEQDRIGSVLAEASRNNTEANIKKVLTQYKLTPAVAADFKALVDDIKSAPVDIFEAKPERVVGLDEVKYAIVPSDVNSDVTTALNNAGIETKTYENGNEADRLKVLNTLSDVRFSKQLDTDTSSEITQADVEQLRSIGRKSISEFTSEDIQKSEKWAKKFYSELGTKSPFFRAWFGDWRENDTGKTNVVTVPTIDISQAYLEHGNYTVNDTGWKVYAGKTLNDDTRHHTGGNRINVKSLNAIELILKNAILFDTIVSETDTNKKSANTAFLHKLYTPIIYDGQYYIAKSTVEEYYNESIKDASRRAYNLKTIKIEPAGGQLGTTSSSSRPDTDSAISISDLYALVKRYDKDFKSQQSSKVVNTDGTPKVVYHGTNADFWAFSLANRGKNGEKLGVGYYFVDDKSSAERYGDRVIEAYLDIKKPASAEVMEISRKDWEKFLDFAIEHRDEYIDGEWKGNEINKEYELTDYDYGSNDAALIKGFLNGIAAGNKDVTEAYLEMLKDSTGYDGVEYTSDGKTYYVAFTPNQIKSATDNIGTFDKDTADIRYSKQLDANGKEFVRVDDTTINEKNPKDIVKALKQIAESKGFYNMEINGQSIGLSNKRGINEWVFSRNATSLYKNDPQAFNDKMQSFQNVDELLETAKSFINEEAVHKKKFDNFARGIVRFKVGDNGYLADILVGIRRNQNAELYDIVNLVPAKITEASNDSVVDNTTQISGEASADTSILQNSANVNTSEKNNSETSDIRYSRELLTPEQKKIRRLEERNDFLERQLVQTNPLGGKARAVSPTTKAKIAKQLAAGMPGVRTSEVNEKLTEVFNAIEHSGAGTREEYRDAVTKAAEKAATELYNDFKVDNVNPLYEEFTDLYKHIRGMKFKITDTVKNDMNDFAEFKKSVRGVLRFDNENGLPVDTAYMELYDMQPSLFADNAGEPIGNQGDQLIRIAEVQEKISKEAGHPYQDASQEDDAYIIRTIRDAILSSYVENSKETLASQNKTLRRENEKLSEKAAATDAYAKELRDVRTMYDNQTKEELARIYREFVSQVRDQQKQLEKNSEKIERLNDRISRNNVNAAQKTALREIGRLHDMLTNPTKQKHIPQELRIAVGRYLNTLNGTKLLNGKTVNSETIKSELSDDYSRILSQIGDVTSKLTRSSLDGKPTDYISASKEQINMLERKVKYISELAHGETVDMSDNIDFIRNITDITRIVNHLVKDSNDLFTGARTEEAVDFANEWKSELSGHKSKVGEIGSERSGLKKWFDGVGYSLMSADLFFGTMGESGEKISGWYRNAQTRQVKMKREYAEYMKKLLGDNYSTIAGSVKARNNLIDVEIAGEKIKVSKNQLMSLYLLWNRPAGRRHIESGGVSFVNKNGETGKTYDIYPRTFDSLMSHLSKDDIRIADGIGDFLSENCSEWGNEASMQLYGIRLYNDPKYFPIRTVSDSIETNFNNLENTHTLENSSFTKKLSKTASAPLAIGDVFDIADRHVNDMSAYSAYAPLNNSISRVFNTEGVKASLRNAYGKAGVMYVENFIDKVNGNSPKKDTSNRADKAMTWIPNNAKRAAVSLNISTALKQPISIVRAAIVINPKYLSKAYAMITPGVNNIVKQGREYNRILDLMNEYSGIAVIKSMGYSDTGFGETTRDTYDEQNLKSAYNKAKYLRDKYDDITMRPAEFADEITWVRMWKACELEAKEKYGSSLSADEFNKKVASRFNEIIGKTQVVDSILDTAPLSTNPTFRTFFPFMNEPVKTAATLVSAAENVRNGKAGAKKQLAKAAACYVISNNLVEPIVTSLVGMWRHDSPDDPEEFAKMFLKRFIGVDIDGETTFADVIASNVADGIFGVPFIVAWYDAITGKLQGFDPERMDLQPVADLIGNAAYFANSLEKEDYENQKTKINYFTDMMSSLTQILGVPGSTLKRDLSALARSAVNTVGGYVAQWELNKVYYNLGNANARANKNFYDIMAKAYKAGDTEAYRYMLNDLKKTQVGAKSFGVPYSKMNQYITERGGEIEVGSDMWNVSLQAEYNLPTFNPTMRVEKAVTDIYQKATAAKLKNADNAIYKSPTSRSQAKFSVNGDDYEMTAEEFETYVSGTGDFAYKITTALTSNYQWSELNAEQKLYALEKTYEFSRAYWKKKIKPEYSPQTKWISELCGTKVDFAAYARVIVNKSKEK